MVEEIDWKYIKEKVGSSNQVYTVYKHEGKDGFSLTGVMRLGK